MKTFLRYTGKLLLGLVGLLVLVIIVIKLITDNQYREWINGAVSKATGRVFSIDHLELDIGTTLRAKADGISLSNATWGEEPEALAASSLEAEIRLLALFRGLADVTVVGEGIDVSVESGPDGQSNWQFGPTKEPVAGEEEAGSTGGLPIRPFIRRLALLDTEITSTGGPATLPRRVTINELAVTTPQSDTLVSLDAAIDEYPLRLKGSLGPLDQVLDRVSAPLTLDASLADVALGINGQWGPLVPALDLAAQISLAAPSISAILAMVGIEMADPGALDVSAELLSDGGQLALRSVETSVGGELVELSASGSINNVNALDGIDFNVLVDTDTLHRLVTHFGVELPGELPALATVEARVHGGMELLSVSDIKIQVGDEGVSAGVAGDIQDVIGLKGVTGRFSADIASTSTLSKFAGVEVPAIGSMSLAGQIDDAEGALALHDFTADLVNGDNVIRLIGRIGNVLEVDGIDAGINIDIKQFSQATLAELTRVLADNGVDFTAERLPDSLSLQAKVAGGMNNIAVDDVAVSVLDSGLELALRGSVENALDLTGAQGTLSLRGPVTEVLREQTGLTLPNTGNLDLEARVDYLDGVARLSELEGGLTGGVTEIALSGEVADLLSVDGIDIVASIALDALTEAERDDVEALLAELEVTGVPLSLLPASVALDARLDGNLERLSLQDISGLIEDPGISIGIEGRVENLLQQPGIEADIALEVESVAGLSRYAQTDLPDLGKLGVDARIVTDQDTYRLEQLTAALVGKGLKMNAEGSVADLINLKGIRASLDGGIDSMAVLSDIVARELPDTAAVALTARLEEAAGGGSTLSANLASGGARLSVESSLSDLMSPADLVVDIQASAETLADLDDFVGKEVPDIGPFRLGGVVSANQAAGEYSLKDFRFELDQQSASGTVEARLAEAEGGRTSIRGNLDVATLDLSPFIIPDDIARQMEGELVATAAEEPGSGGEQKEAEQSAKPQQPAVQGDAADVPVDAEAKAVNTDRLFPDDPILLDQMREVDIDFALTAREIILGNMDLQDFETRLVLNQGKLKLEPFRAIDDGGSINGNIEVDASSETTDMTVSLLVDKVRMPVSGANLNLNVDLAGAGTTPAQLMASLDGQVLLWVHDGVIPSSFATRFGSGLFSFSGDQQTTELECAVVRMDIEDGFVDFDDKIAAQLSSVNWLGGGDINLHTEEIGIGITPKPREGIGIGAGTLASLVYIGGTLKNPGVRLNPADVAVKYGKYMAYISTGGLSLLAEALFNKARAGKDFCAPLLEETVFEQSQEEGESGGSEDPS